ncbi:MAG TPA: DUF945 domain-containing protein [Halothiobacillaceae bacterium]|nr:DUF945 domain-containing protein [Halothiobacillaceae bacterium]
MKWIIGAIAGVVVIGAAGAPYVSGHLFEDAFNQAEPVALPIDGLYWQPESYERGYLNSEARSQLIFRQAGQQDVVINLTHHVQQHLGIDGRYARIKTHLDLDDNPQAKALIDEWLDGQDLPPISTELYPSGKSLSRLSLPEINHPLTAFSGADISFSTQRQGWFGYEFTMPELRFTEHAAQNTDGQALIEGVHFVGEGRVSEEGMIWDGRSHLTADRLLFSGGGEDQIDLHQLSLNARSDREDDQVNLSFEMRFGALEVPNDTLRNGHYRLSIERLDAPAIATIAKRINELNQLGNLKDEDLNAQYQRVLTNQLPQLLSQGPRLRLAPFTAESEFGASRVDLALSLAPNAMPAEMGPLAILALIGSLSIEGSLQLPLAMLEAQYQQTDPTGSIEQELALLVAEGWVTIEDEILSTTINYDRGRLELNGQPADALLNLLLGF